MIPKIIHYCWLSNDPIPGSMRQYMKSWKEFLPDYEFIKWDFSRFNKDSSVWVSEAFENRKYAFAADYIRLYALYNYGGIYMDMDVQVLKTFNPMLTLKTMMCYENRDSNNTPAIEAAIIGAEKKQAWLKTCLDYYTGRHFVKLDGSFDMIPLPDIVMDILKNKYKVINVFSAGDALNANDCEIPIFPCTYFSPKSYSSLKYKMNSETYCIHHFDGTWKGFFWTKFRRFLVDKLHVNGRWALRITRWLDGETLKKYHGKLISLLRRN